MMSFENAGFEYHCGPGSCNFNESLKRVCRTTNNHGQPPAVVTNHNSISNQSMSPSISEDEDVFENVNEESTTVQARDPEAKIPKIEEEITS
ncbi:hypothetical protein ACOME3_001718 [Neoechinorhynchus agilis]